MVGGVKSLLKITSIYFMSFSVILIKGKIENNKKGST